MSCKTLFKGLIRSALPRRGVNFVTIRLAAKRPSTSISGTRLEMLHHMSMSSAIARLAARRPLTSIPGIRPCMFHHMNVRFSIVDSAVRRLSTARTPSYKCELCDRLFASQKALSKHLRYSSAHFQLPKTPLNMFFQSFDGFKFDPNLPPSESYSSLQRFYGWRKGDEDSAKAWDQYQEALTQELKLWFGVEDDIAAWHSLCRAVRIEPLPRSCLECEKAVRGIYVNIVDLIDWARSRGNDSEIRLFHNLKELQDYTKSTGKIFRNNLDETGNGNVVLRHLLRFILR